MLEYPRMVTTPAPLRYGKCSLKTTFPIMQAIVSQHEPICEVKIIQ